MDQSQVRGEEVPEEAGSHRDSHQRRAQIREAVEREEVPQAQQRHHGSQDEAEISARTRKHVSFHPVSRYGPAECVIGGAHGFSYAMFLCKGSSVPAGGSKSYFL